VQRDQAHTVAGVGVGVALGERSGDARHLFLGGGAADSRTQPADRDILVAVAARGERQRRPQIELAAVVPDDRVLEAGGQHADDRVRLAVEDDGPAEHVGVGLEASLPEGVADDGDPVDTFALFLCGEGPAEGRAHAQDLEQTHRRHAATQSLRGLAAGEHIRAARQGDHAVEAAARFSPVLEVGGCDRYVRRPRVGVPDGDEPVGLGVGERPQEDGPQDAEDGCVGTDAKRQD
jgi:hypothetical protein